MTGKLTIKNILTYFEIEEWREDECNIPDGYNGFTFIEKEGEFPNESDNEKLFNKIHDKMSYEISCRIADKKKSLMWVEEVKRRSNWKKGDTIYGVTKEEGDTYDIGWSREKQIIRRPYFIIDPEGFIAFVCFNMNYSWEETDLIKNYFYIRPDSLYNDKIFQQDLKECREKDKIAEQERKAEQDLIKAEMLRRGFWLGDDGEFHKTIKVKKQNKQKK